MANPNALYDVVDENDQVTGQATKDRLHKEGLLHRGVNVLFYNKTGVVILQRRAPNKSTFPNKLDVTVGGHVDAGDSYEEAALKEVFEETGLQLVAKDLTFLMKFRRSNEDKSTGTISNYFSVVYAFNYEKGIDALKVEQGKATGFVIKQISEIINARSIEGSEYAPSLVKEDYGPVWEKLLELINFNKNQVVAA